VSRYQKGKTNLDFTEARDSEWQWDQLGHMQVCTSLQTDNHASTPPPPLSFFTGRMPFLLPNQQRQRTESISTGIDTERNYVTVSKFIVISKEIRQTEQVISNQRNAVAQVSKRYCRTKNNAKSMQTYKTTIYNNQCLSGALRDLAT